MGKVKRQKIVGISRFLNSGAGFSRESLVPLSALLEDLMNASMSNSADPYVVINPDLVSTLIYAVSIEYLCT